MATTTPAALLLPVAPRPLIGFRLPIEITWRELSSLGDRGSHAHLPSVLLDSCFLYNGPVCSLYGVSDFFWRC